MAEERLIDDDKDRKYKIRINENGEEELVIVDTEEEEEEIPEYGVVTNEENSKSIEESEDFAAQREKQQEIRKNKVLSLKHEGKLKLEKGDFEGAQYAFFQAGDITEYDGELYYLQLLASSRNMTDFLELDKCLSASEGVKEYSSDEQKAELLEKSQPLKERISEFETNAAKLNEENEKGKAERREVFLNGRSRATLFLACAAVPFVVAAVLAIFFASKLVADSETLYIALTVAFGVLALALLVLTLVALNRFWTANRKVKLNEKNSSTRIGREYDACAEELEKLKTIYLSFGNDIS